LLSLRSSHPSLLVNYYLALYMLTCNIVKDPVAHCNQSTPVPAECRAKTTHVARQHVRGERFEAPEREVEDRSVASRTEEDGRMSVSYSVR